MNEESGRMGSPFPGRLRGVLTRNTLDAQAILDRTTSLANTLHQEALNIIEQKGADMTAAEAQRVLRLFLLRRLLLDGADVKELASMGKEVASIFPPAKSSDGELRVAV